MRRSAPVSLPSFFVWEKGAAGYKMHLTAEILHLTCPPIAMYLKNGIIKEILEGSKGGMFP